MDTIKQSFAAIAGSVLLAGCLNNAPDVTIPVFSQAGDQDSNDQTAMVWPTLGDGQPAIRVGLEQAVSRDALAIADAGLCNHVADPQPAAAEERQLGKTGRATPGVPQVVSSRCRLA